MYELIERVDKDLTGWVSQDLTAWKDPFFFDLVFCFQVPAIRIRCGSFRGELGEQERADTYWNKKDPAHEEVVSLSFHSGIVVNR